MSELSHQHLILGKYHYTFLVLNLLHFGCI